MIRLHAPIRLSDTGERLIEGVAVPYDTEANASTGAVMFLPGSLKAETRPKLLRDHDMTQAIGLVTGLEDGPDGLRFTARISATAAGEEALTLALDGVLDAVSVGVNPIEAERIDGVLVVAQGELVEISMTAFPAFKDARIDRVAATDQVDAEPEPDPDPETETQQDPNPSEEDITMDQTTEATVPTAPLQFNRRPAKPVTAGEFIAATLTGNMTPRIQAVVADEVVADIPGLVPELLVGSVFDTLNEDRPLVSALGTLAMPAGGETFNRRKVTQHTDVDVQANEYDILASQTYDVAKVPVTKKWVGGSLNLSEQAIAYSDQSLIDLVIRDMARMYARRTEIIACTELIGGASTATATITDFTDGDEVIEDLYLAAAEIKAGMGLMPTHLIVSTGIWAQLGAAKDSGGNRIFPFLGPSNAAGTLNGATSLTGNPLGLSLIVSDDIVVSPATDAAVIFNARALEVYEERRGALRVEQPSTLSTQLAFRGVFAVADMDLAVGALSLI